MSEQDETAKAIEEQKKQLEAAEAARLRRIREADEILEAKPTPEAETP